MVRDSRGRSIDYLRISVIDRCNLRCIYCMPSSGVKWIEYKEILSYEEILKVVGVLSEMGIRKIRLTGGEPLMRKNIQYLVGKLNEIDGIEEITITTNGLLLERYAMELKESGLHRINVSLDSLNPDRYREITRGGDLGAVIKGIEIAEEIGLTPVSINMVPVRGFNDDEIEEFALLTFKRPWRVRFIEFMPVGGKEFWTPERYVPEREIRERVMRIGELIQLGEKSGGPARYWRLRGATGTIGFISALTNHFCNECNRLRLTSDGRLRPCLFSETWVDLKPSLRGGTDEELRRLINLAIQCKPDGHNLSGRRDFRELSPMSRIGG